MKKDDLPIINSTLSAAWHAHRRTLELKDGSLLRGEEQLMLWAYQKNLRGALKQVSNRDDAEDIASIATDQFLDLLREGGDIGDVAAVNKTILDRRVKDYIRKKVRRQNNELPIKADMPAVDFTLQCDSGIRSKALRSLAEKAVARLFTPRQTAIFMMFVFEEMTYAEIAEKLGIPETTVRSNISRAFKKLRTDDTFIQELKGLLTDKK